MKESVSEQAILDLLLCNEEELINNLVVKGLSGKSDNILYEDGKVIEIHFKLGY